MEYFILNEHSLPIGRTNETECLTAFFDVYKKAAKQNFKHIRISQNMDSHWYEIPISESRTIRNWISRQEKDYSTRLKNLISSTCTPVFTKEDIEAKNRASLSDFYYETTQVPILGATYLLKQLSFSFNSNNNWNKSFFKLIHQELIGDEIVEKEVGVNNVTNENHWDEHFNSILEERSNCILNGRDKALYITKEMPFILFTKDACKQLEKEKSSTFLSEIWGDLLCLNKICENSENISLQHLKDQSGINMSDESDTVKNNPKLKRYRMKMYNGVRYFFGYHLKNFQGNKRVHFIIEDGKIIIGYLGEHLPL